MRKSIGKAKRKPFKVGETLPSDMVDKLSELFNQSYFYRKKPDYSSVMRIANNLVSKIDAGDFPVDDIKALNLSLKKDPSSVMHALKNSSPNNIDSKNKLISQLNDEIAKARQPNHSVIKAGTLSLWEEMKPEILLKHQDYAPLIEKLDAALLSAFDSPAEDWTKK